MSWTVTKQPPPVTKTIADLTLSTVTFHTSTDPAEVLVQFDDGSNNARVVSLAFLNATQQTQLNNLLDAIRRRAVGPNGEGMTEV